MKHVSVLIILSLLSCLLFFNCAAESPPGGGPPDTQAPLLVFSSIRNGATGVDPDLILRFVFSESLNSKTAEKSITVFPLSETPSLVSVRGKTISISPEKSWKPDLVYTVILGKNISDLRNNSLPEPLQFSFTAGDFMPREKIRGRVYGLRSGAGAVIAISRKDTHPDSILRAPEFFTQTGPDGSFSFEHLPPDSFHVAGYIDMDKSNDYKATLDGVCVPAPFTVLPDTLEGESVALSAVYDNFFPPRLLDGKSLHPAATLLTFSKKPAEWNQRSVFTVNGMSVDTVAYDGTTCILYHPVISSDTLLLSIRGLADHLNCQLPDTLLKVKIGAFSDSTYLTEQKQERLVIMPPPPPSYLTGRYETVSDTLTLTLEHDIHGFYIIPPSKTATRGTLHVRIPLHPGFPDLTTDTVYAIPLKQALMPEYGTVMGMLLGSVPEDLRLVLWNDTQRYEVSPQGNAFHFLQVLPGTYSLSRYEDKNRNKRLDPGRPFPYIAPEIQRELDRNIDVRSRWDTELSAPYKIGVENE